MTTPAVPVWNPGPVGLLYPGEMGTAVGTLLRRAGCRVVTTLADRGPTTQRNCRAAGFEVLPGVQDVVRTASVLLSLVPPGAALQVAEEVRAALDPSRSDQPTYVDLNSLSPDTAHAIAGLFAGTGVEFVDGAISGPAARLEKGCVLYLSGPQAARVAALFEGRMALQVLGDRPGQASTIRMLLSGLTKGVVALFVEMALAARQAGVLDRLLTAYRGSYPGIMEVVERSLPTYPLHAARRGTEMAEVEKTLTQLGLGPTVVPGVRELTVAIGQCWTGADPSQRWTTSEIVEELHARRLLRRGPATASE
jgi:3-hydroxyisobutyrate dehydrogenase-like beta-hydroxyacid dehydrogenase